MARPRGTSTAAKSTAKTSPVGGASTSQELTCPECGRVFTRAAALGAHRRRAHGVVGTSKARSRRSKTARTTAGSGRNSRRTARADQTTARGETPALDRDALLQTLFPNGVPAREAVIRAANDWLDRAEELARL